MSDLRAPSGEEDARLVARVRDGDRDAFERLVRRHLRAAHRAALRRTSDPHDAEDVCQDAFVKALRRIEDCEHPERFRSWLLAIVRNTALDAADRRRSEGETLDLQRGPATTGTPARDLERAQLRDRLSAALDALPPKQREVLVLHDYEGWSHGEIADELGIAAGTSRYHLHEARKSMRAELSTSRSPHQQEAVP